jgi:hypothetical protein
MVNFHPRSRLTLLAVAAGILVGIGFRVYTLTHDPGGFDSDEAVTGLIARHFVSDPLDHQAFFWGQGYGGTLPPMVTALPFAIFGSSVLALKLTEVVWHAVAAVLVWRIGRRLLDERAGVVAGVIVWIWPALGVHWSTKARGFYGTLEVLGLVLLLCALRLTERPDSRKDWMAAGAAAGLGWWTNPQIVYLALPAVIWFVVLNRRTWRAVLAARAWLWALPTAVVGAAPWFWWNLHHHWNSIGGHNPGINRAEGFDGHFLRILREGLPVTFGLRVPYGFGWITSPSAIAKVLYAGALAAVAAALLVRRQGALLLAIALALYPVLHALGPVAGVTAEGRYFFCYLSLLALALARLARTRLATAALFGVLVVSTLTGLWKIPPGNTGITSGKLVPRSLGPLISSLRAEKINAVFAEYWIAYRLTFESRERVIASGVDTERYAPYGKFVRDNPAPAWVFLEGTGTEAKFVAGLKGLDAGYRTWRTGGFAVYVTTFPVHPEAVP